MHYTSNLHPDLGAVVLIKDGNKQLEQLPDGSYLITDKIGGSSITFTAVGTWFITDSHNRKPTKRMIAYLDILAAEQGDSNDPTED